MGFKEVRKGVGARSTEEEVREVSIRDFGCGEIHRCSGSRGACTYAGNHGTGRAGAVASAEGELAVEWVIVQHSHEDLLLLVAELERVLAVDPGVVHLWVDQGGFWNCGFVVWRPNDVKPPRCRQRVNRRRVAAKSADRESAKRRRADAQWRLARLGPRDTKPEIEHPVGAKYACVARAIC